MVCFSLALIIHAEPSFSNVSLNKMDQQKNMKGADHLKSNVCSNDKHIEDIISALLAAKFAEVYFFHLFEEDS